MNRENTPLFNQVEKHLVPEETVWQVAAFPLTFPLGIAALVVDGLIIHPVTVVGDAAGDTGDCCWDNFDWDEQYVTECACLPWRVVFTPIVFTTTFVGRWFFDIPRRAAMEREREDNIKEGAQKEERAKLLLQEVRALAAEKRYDLVFVKMSDFSALIRSEEMTEAGSALLKEMEGSDDPVLRWFAFHISFTYGKRYLATGKERVSLLRRTLADPDARLRYSALFWLNQTKDRGDLEALLPDLLIIVSDDDDPILRSLARQLIEYADA